jgi:hypothetical protein
MRKVHREKASWAGRFRLSVYPHDSTGEPLNGLGRDLIRVLCHWALPQNHTLVYPTNGITRMADKGEREVGPTGGQ